MKAKLKKYTNYAINIVIGIILIMTLSRYISAQMTASKLVGGAVNLDHLQLANDTVPEQAIQPRALVFFATWCQPCLLELRRIKSAVAAGDLDPNRVVAISIDDSRADLDRYLEEADPGIPVFFDVGKMAARSAQLKSTPTIVYLDENHRIADVSTGVSVFLIGNLQDSYKDPG